MCAERDNNVIYHHVPFSLSVPTDPSDQEYGHKLDSPQDHGTAERCQGRRDAERWEVRMPSIKLWVPCVQARICKEKRNDWAQLEIAERAEHRFHLVLGRVVNALMLHLELCNHPISLRRWTHWTARLGCHLVRLEDGMSRVPTLVEDVRRLARRNSATR